MSKISNTPQGDGKVLYSWKKNRMLWKETGFRKQIKKRKKSVKWLCDEIKEITYKENNNKNIDEK